MSAHRVDVYRTDYDCTNNGVTSPDMAAGRTFYVVTSLESAEKIEESWAKLGKKGAKPVCLLYREKNVFGDIHKYVVPTHITGHSMMGGNFVYSCDSRFRELSASPLPVHDRVE